MKTKKNKNHHYLFFGAVSLIVCINFLQSMVVSIALIVLKKQELTSDFFLRQSITALFVIIAGIFAYKFFSLLNKEKKYFSKIKKEKKIILPLEQDNTELTYVEKKMLGVLKKIILFFFLLFLFSSAKKAFESIDTFNSISFIIGFFLFLFLLKIVFSENKKILFSNRYKTLVSWDKKEDWEYMVKVTKTILVIFFVLLCVLLGLIYLADIYK